MKAEVIGWVATAVGTPIVIVTLCWTLVIFHCHRHYWRSTDLLIAAILSQGVIKQIGTFAYTILTLLQLLDSNEAWCSGIVWLLTSIHMLQAGTLATLVFSRLLAVRSPLKYRQAVKRTHIVYHLVSLSVLSSCIGLAAVLAEGKNDHELEEVTNSTGSTYVQQTQHCSFLPHEMDRRYAVLSMTLHSFLDVTSLFALIVTLFSWCCLYRRQKSNLSVSQPSTIVPSSGNQKRKLLTSSSDLSAMSDISLISSARNGSSITQNGGNSNNDKSANTDMVPGKCTTNDSQLMNGLLASNLRYMDSADGKLQLKMTFVPPPPKTTSLDALPALSCTNGLSSIAKSSSDANCFLPNANSALHAAFPNSPGPVTGSSTNKSTDTLTSCVAISNYNHTAPKSLTNSDSNYETYDRNYAATGSGNTEDGCRWTSESSYISTSTSSTNSRAPCLARQTSREEGVMMGHEDLRLPSVICLVVLCYAVNHLPVLGLTAVGIFAPGLLPRVWSLPALVLWAGLAEECLLPLLLSLCDKNFTAWVANIYTCRSRSAADLARQHQGLDGKFRVFSTQTQHQPEVQSSSQSQPQQNHQHLQQEPVKFPITNGSLFTSVDGRLPIIHNYRRGKGMRTSGAVPPHCITTGLPAAQMRRNELLQALINLNTAAIENQNSEHFKQRTNTTDGTIKLSQNFTDKTCDLQAYLPTGMETVEKKVANQVVQNSRQQEGNLLTEFRTGNLKSEQPSSDCEDYLNSDDLNEYNVDDDDDDDDDEPIYATLSSHSCCSATTAANDDFEFFQHEEKMSETVDDRGNDVVVQNDEKFCVHGTQSEERNSDQSLLYRYQREIFGNAEHVPQAYQCADWTVDQNNEVLKLVLPLIQSYQNQNNNTELSYQNNEQYNGKNLSHCQTITQNESEVMKTVVQNEFKNYKYNALMKGASGRTRSSTDPESKKKYSNYNSQKILSKGNRKNLQMSPNDQKEDVTFVSSNKNHNLKLPHFTSVTRNQRVQKQNFLAGSVSLNNLDELLLEEEQNDLVVHRRSRRNCYNEMRNGPQNDPSSSDEREVVFELPVKSESVLSLYQLDLDGENSSGRHNMIETSCKEANSKRFHKQVPGNRRILGQPLTRHSVQQTPPRRRPHKQKRLPVPVLSVESLTTALNCAGVSYLDTGDVCRHGSVPDLKRVFVSDYI